ncbi:hypothetical protein O5D80_006218 [Batrachochytrium dendrobatidis]|nr:hypothetical protein O5D80_006218 [Batrachochytrium dendrobatidis]
MNAATHSAEAALIDILILVVTNELANRTDISAFSACSPSTLRLLHTPSIPSRYSWEATVMSAINLFEPLLSSASSDIQRVGVRNIVAFMDYTIYCLQPLSAYIDLQPTDPNQYVDKCKKSIMLIKSLSLLISTGFKRLPSVEYHLDRKTLLQDDSDPSQLPESGLLPYRNWLQALYRIMDKYVDIGMEYFQSTDHTIATFFQEHPHPWLLATVFCMFNYMQRYTMLLPYNADSVKILTKIEGDIVSLVCHNRSLSRKVLIFPIAFIGSHIKRLFSPSEPQNMQFQASFDYIANIFGVNKTNIDSAAADEDAFIPWAHVHAWRKYMLTYDFATDLSKTQKFSVPIILRDIMLVDLIFGSQCQIELLCKQITKPNWVFIKKRTLDSSAFVDEYFFGIADRFILQSKPDTQWILTSMLIRAIILQESLLKFCQPTESENRLETLVFRRKNHTGNVPISLMPPPISSTIQEFFDLRYIFKAQAERTLDLCLCLNNWLTRIIKSEQDLLKAMQCLPSSFWIHLALCHENPPETTIGDSFMVTLYSCMLRIDAFLTANSNSIEVLEPVKTESDTNPAQLPDIYNQTTAENAMGAQSLPFGLTWYTFFIRMHIPGVFVHAFVHLQKKYKDASKAAQLCMLEGIEVDLCGSSEVLKERAQKSFEMACLNLVDGNVSCMAFVPIDSTQDITSNDLQLSYLRLTELVFEYRSLLLKVNYQLFKALLTEPVVLTSATANTIASKEMGEIGEDEPDTPWAKVSELTTLNALYKDYASLSHQKRLSFYHEDEIAKRAKKCSRPNLLLMDGILDSCVKNESVNTQEFLEYLDGWNALACTLPPKALRDDLEDILTNYYPSDSMRLLDRVLAEFLFMHSWIISDTVTMLKLDGSGQFYHGSSPSVGTKIPQYHRRQAPYYALLGVFCDQSTLPLIGPIDTVSTAVKNTIVDMTRPVNNIPVMQLLRGLRSRLLSDSHKPNVELSIFEKSNAAVKLISDILDSAHSLVSALFFYEIFELAEPLTLGPTSSKSVVKKQHILPIVLAAQILNIGSDSNQTLCCIAASIYMFGRLDVLNDKAPYALLHRVLGRSANHTSLFYSFRIMAQMEDRDRRSGSLNLIRALLIAPLGVDQNSAAVVGKRFTKICRASFMESSQTQFISSWLTSIFNIVLEFGDQPLMMAPYLLRHILNPKSHYFQTATTSNLDESEPRGDILDGWLQLLVNAYSHPNLPVVLGIWKECFCDMPLSDLLQFLCRCSISSADPLVDFFSKELLALLKTKKRLNLELLDSILVSRKPEKMLAMAKQSLSGISLNSSIRIDICKFMEQKFMLVMEMVYTNGSNLMLTWQSALKTTNMVLDHLLEWDVSLALDCLSSPTVADFFIGALLIFDASQAKVMTATLSMAYKAVLLQTTGTTASNGKLQIFKKFVLVHESTWRLYIMRILGRFSDESMVALLNPLLKDLLLSLKVFERTEFADVLAECTTSTFVGAIHTNNVVLLNNTASLLRYLVNEWASTRVCESVYSLISTCCVFNVNTVSNSIMLMVSSLVPGLYQATQTHMESVVIFGVMRFLSTCSDSTAKSMTLDIVEQCCALRVNRAEMLCSLEYIIYALAGGHHQTYLRAVDALKLLRNWKFYIGEHSKECKSPFVLSWTAKATQDTALMDQRLNLTVEMFDMNVAKGITNLIGASSLLGERAYLGSALARISSD